MKMRKFLVSLAVALTLTAGILVYLWPRAPAPRVSAPVPALTEAPGTAPGQEEAVAEARRAEIAAAYAELQAARKSLQQELGNLKGRVWGLELPGATAKKIGDDMMAAQFLLKEPPLLGAFSDVAGVRAEQARVDAARTRLGEISRELGATGAP